MGDKNKPAKTLDAYRKDAACRQARWREKQQQDGIVHTTFTLAECDIETFRKLAAASRDSARVRNTKGDGK